MNTARVLEILDSMGVIEVRYHQSPVWIQAVQGDMAEVEFLDTLEYSRVPIADLIEC